MIVTVFKSRLRPENRTEYGTWLARMREIAVNAPGYISHKSYEAEDGERVTLAFFESEETLNAWARQKDHVEAKRKGHKDFYAEYDVMICNIIRRSSWPRNQD